MWFSKNCQTELENIRYSRNFKNRFPFFKSVAVRKVYAVSLLYQRHCTPLILILKYSKLGLVINTFSKNLSGRRILVTLVPKFSGGDDYRFITSIIQSNFCCSKFGVTWRPLQDRSASVLEHNMNKNAANRTGLPHIEPKETTFLKDIPWLFDFYTFKSFL